MESVKQDQEAFEQEIRELRAQLAEAQEALRAIREGEVDGLIVSTPEGPRVFTLQGADQTYRTIVEQMREGAVTLDEDGHINYCNQRFAEMLKRPLEKIIGSRLCEHVIDPDRLVVQHLVRQAHEGAARGELTLRAADGSLIPIHAGLGALVHDGMSSISLVVTDLTDRKRFERLLAGEQFVRAILNQAADGVVVCDTDGRLTFTNPPARRIAQLDAAEPPISSVDRLWRTVLDPQGHPIPFEQQSLPMALAGQVTNARENRVVRDDGSHYDLLMSASPLSDPDGRVIGAVATFTDITERKRAEEELRAAQQIAERARAVAEQANCAKDHFLAVLSHELRTPLTPVVMGVSMLQDRTDLDPVMRETLDIIRRNAEMEARLIDDLLDVTRIARGKIELCRCPIELGTVIDRAVEVCKPDIEARGLRFGVERGADDPYWVEADVARLEQVFWNLLKNAIKFTPPGGCVGVRCRPAEGHVLVEVHDSGIGIEPEALSRVFNAFEQADMSITRRFGGLGLGLAISKALVEMHGGTIEVHSEGRDQGATFRIRLPLTSPAGQLDRAAPAASSPHGVGPLRILLVEDHSVTAKMMRMVLSAEGYTVETAGDAATALDLADRQPFDLLVSDLGLPDGSGHDLLRELRGRGHCFPAIALSGYGQEDDIERSYQAGFATHLTKPASREAVVETVFSVAAAVRNQSDAV